MHKLIDLKDITTVYEFVRLKHPSWILSRVYRRLWLFTQRSSSRTSLFTKKSRVGTVQWWVRWIQSFYSWCRIWNRFFQRLPENCSWSRCYLCCLSGSPKVRCTDVSRFVQCIKNETNMFLVDMMLLLLVGNIFVLIAKAK